MIKVVALYKFVKIENSEALKNYLISISSKLKGTLIIAKEGINGTVAGEEKETDKFITELTKLDLFVYNLEIKFSYSIKIPFLRMKIKIKDEIVSMGIKKVDPVNQRGEYIEPTKWNNLISQDDVIIIDTRNDYEYEIGSFEGAINPNTQNFREFPQFIKNSFIVDTNKTIAMYCTGGIRCEKSTSYLKLQGFEKVFHLKGGILKYLEEISENESLWNGECFVFDERVSVVHGLKQGSFDQCYACRYPVSEQQKLSKFYKQGISCHRCYSKQSKKNLLRATERQKQMELASSANYCHLGS